MESSRPSDFLYDQIRRKKVEKKPEELIRQLLVRQMVESFGYSRSLIAIEKELSQLPLLKRFSQSKIPKRRVDILVFSKSQATNTLTPLLIVECKATALTPTCAQQVIGYNCFIGAPFIALANEQQAITGFFDQEAGMYRFEEGFPSCGQLLLLLRKNINESLNLRRFSLPREI